MEAVGGEVCAHRQERCGESVVDGSKHGDALIVSIQVELQSFALQAANAVLLDRLRHKNQASTHADAVRQLCQVASRHTAIAMMADMTYTTACFSSGSVEAHVFCFVCFVQKL